jgi:hypothetical protein
MSNINLKCNICHDNDGIIISCNKCYNTCHPHCLGLDEKKSGNWICNECDDRMNNRNNICSRCKINGGLGKLSEDGKYIHFSCAMHLSMFSDDKRYKDRYNKSGEIYLCFCGKPGGTLPCGAGKKCKRLLHEKCVLEKNGFIGYIEHYTFKEFGKYKSFGCLCNIHNDHCYYELMDRNYTDRARTFLQNGSGLPKNTKKVTDDENKHNLEILNNNNQNSVYVIPPLNINTMIENNNGKNINSIVNKFNETIINNFDEKNTNSSVNISSKSTNSGVNISSKNTKDWDINQIIDNSDEKYINSAIYKNNGENNDFTFHITSSYNLYKKQVDDINHLKNENIKLSNELKNINTSNTELNELKLKYDRIKFMELIINDTNKLDIIKNLVMSFNK